MFPVRGQIRPLSRPRGSSVPHDEGRSLSPVCRTSWLVVRAGWRPLGFALLLAMPGGAQFGPVQMPSQQVGGQQPGVSVSGMSDTDPIDEERRLRALNAERQKSLVSDTNKLLKLARDLDNEVNRTNPDSLTLAELSKVAEIEKLAHRVKEKMSTSVRGTTDIQPLFDPQIR